MGQIFVIGASHKASYHRVDDEAVVPHVCILVPSYRNGLNDFRPNDGLAQLIFKDVEHPVDIHLRCSVCSHWPS